VLLVNLGTAPVRIRRGDRIAQLVVAPVTAVVWREVAQLPETARGTGGFGSTNRASEVR
jgi:dUTP pyrophosphatase